MKIEWLDDELTEARLTRGWFRKETVVVQHVRVREYSADDWQFSNGVRCPAGMETWLDSRRRDEERRRARATQEGAWVPVRKLPAARVVR